MLHFLRAVNDVRRDKYHEVLERHNIRRLGVLMYSEYFRLLFFFNIYSKGFFSKFIYILFFFFFLFCLLFLIFFFFHIVFLVIFFIFYSFLLSLLHYCFKVFTSIIPF